MNNSITLKTIAEHIQAEMIGNGDIIIHGIAPLETAQAGELAFIISSKHQKKLAQTQAGAVILPAALATECPVAAMLVVPDPYLAFAKAAELFDRNPRQASGIHPTAIIGRNSKVAASAAIGAYVVIGDDVEIRENVQIDAQCVIDDRCILDENAWLKARVCLGKDVTIGARSIIHQGAVIGADGFGNAKQGPAWYKIPQLGGVVIGADVEIGANTTVDCGTLGDTIIADGVRIDNLVQIAHNVQIGEHTAIAGQTGIAGSTRIGKHCLFAGQVGINGHIEICDNVIFTGQAMVTHSIAEPGVYSSGTGLLPNAQWRKCAVHFRNADKVARKRREESHGIEE